MSLQNRINPEGEICRSSARGTLMGNRGCLHNDAREIVARSKRDAWVTCLTEVKGIKRRVMGAGNYTELFFLDGGRLCRWSFAYSTSQIADSGREVCWVKKRADEATVWHVKFLRQID